MKLRGFGHSVFMMALILSLSTIALTQDYRGKVQGVVTDESGGIVPGSKVILLNEKTKVEVTTISNDDGNYKFDFVEPGDYSVAAEKDGFKKTIQQNLIVRIQGDLTVNMKLAVGDVAATVTVEDTPIAVQFGSSGAALTLDNATVDQMPVRGRNPYNIVTLDPSINGGENAAGENRPYHHAFGNDVDAGGGTRGANEVQLNGTGIASTAKVAYTPSVDAVQEVTFSRSSVDAEQGFSAGGTISLNMKSGGSKFHGAAYYYKRDPRFNAFGDPTLARIAGADEKSQRGTNLSMVGGNIGGPIIKKKVFFFSSYERWTDARPISVKITVPTLLERAGDFSQSGRAIYIPNSSTSNSSARTQFAGNIIPTAMFDPVAVKLLAQMPLPNLPGNDLNWQGTKTENVKYWNLSTRADWNISEKMKAYFSYGQFKANLLENNPDAKNALLFPRTGSNRYGLSLAADLVYTINSNTVLNLRAGYHRLTDEAAVPDAILGRDGLTNLWGTNTFYTSALTREEVYYPAFDVIFNGGVANRLGRVGREFAQYPQGGNAAARINTSVGNHSIKYGGEYRIAKGKAARFEPLNFYFDQNLTARTQSTSSADLLTSGNPWASFLLGVLEPNGTATNNNNTVARVPVQEVIGKGYAAYLQDDWKISKNLTLNLGLRWEYEPGPIDAQNRTTQRLDLSQPIPEIVAAPPVIPANVQAIMAAAGVTHTWNGAWVFSTADSRSIWKREKTDFLPRIGFALKLDDNSSLRVGFARYIQPSSKIRDTLGAFVEQYAGYSTRSIVSTPSFSTTPANNILATLSNPFPTSGIGTNPVLLPTAQTLGRYTNLGNPVALDEYDQRPPINDKYTISYQRQIWNKMILSVDYFMNAGSRLPQTVDINAPNPQYFYQTPRSVWNINVANPFLNYLTADKFPGALRNQTQISVTNLLRPFPQYGAINQDNTDLRKSRIQSLKFQIQQPYYKGMLFVFAYAINDEQTKEAYDDLALFNRQFTWRPTDAAKHRFTNTITWDIPVGKGKMLFSNAPKVVDYILGGWKLTNLTRYYSGRLLQFNTSLVVSGNPKLTNPVIGSCSTCQWFNPAVFTAVNNGTQNQLRNSPYSFKGVVGPATFQTDATLSKSFHIREKMKLEARLEIYNLTNTLNWDNPNLTLGNANFGKVISKRPGYVAREIQYGLRFVF